MDNQAPNEPNEQLNWEPPASEPVNPFGDASLTWQQEVKQEYDREQAEEAAEEAADLAEDEADAARLAELKQKYPDGVRANIEYAAESASDFWWKTLKSSEETWVSSSLRNSVDPNDFSDVSPNWSMTPEEISEWKKGVNEQYWEMLHEAVSPQHAAALKQRALKAQRIDEVVYEDGVVEGISAHLVSSLMDPAAWLITGGTEAVVAPLVLARQSTRLANALRSGLAVGAGSAAVEGVLAYNDPTKGWDDIGLGAASGLILGSVAGAARSIDPVEQTLNTMVAKAAKDFAEQMELDQIVQSGAQLTEKGKKRWAKYLNEDGTVMTREQRVDKILQNIGEVDKTYGSAVRFDRAATTGASENPHTRALSSILFNDAAAAKGHVRGEVATVWKELFAGKHVSSFYRNHQVNFEAYLKEQGGSTVGKGFRHSARAKFNEEVHKAQLGMPVESQAAQRQAKALQEAYEEFRKAILDPSLGQKVNTAVPLADDLSTGPYTTRIWNPEKVMAAVRTSGEEAVANRIARSLMKKSDGLSPERAMSIGRYLVKAVTKVKEHRELDVNKVLSARDLGNLRQILNDSTDLTDDEIEKIASALFSKSKESVKVDAGKTSRLRTKLDLDDRDIIDLIETDSERLFLNYVNSMSGHIALARHGISDEADFKAILAKTDEWLQEELKKPGMTPKKGRKLIAQAQKEKDVLRAAYDHLVGRPLEMDPSGAASTAARLINKMNFTRLMGQMGFTQIPELGVAMTQIGIRSTLRHLPAVLRTLKRAKTDKKFADELMQELSDAMGGWGGERLMKQVTNRVDEMGSRSAIGDRFIDKAEVTLDHMGRVTSDLSGFSIIDAALKNLAAKGQAQEFLNIARRSGKGIEKAFSDSLFAKRGLRMADIGLTKENFIPIAEQLKKHAKYTRSGKLQHLNLDKWEDKDALNRFRLAMKYQMDRSVIQVDFGDRIRMGTGKAWGAEGPLGKILWQFKSFMIASHSKLLVNGWKYRDVKLFNTFMVNSFLTYMVLQGQYHARAWTKPESERERYLESKTNPEDMAKAVFQRSAWVGLIPTATETGARVMGMDPVFTYRSSGLGADPITGTPAYDLIMNGMVPAAGALTQAAFNEDFTYTSSDYQQLTRTLFLQNTLLVRAALTALDDFPKYKIED